MTPVECMYQKSPSKSIGCRYHLRISNVLKSKDVYSVNHVSQREDKFPFGWCHVNLAEERAFQKLPNLERTYNHDHCDSVKDVPR